MPDTRPTRAGTTRRRAVTCPQRAAIPLSFVTPLPTPRHVRRVLQVATSGRGQPNAAARAAPTAPANAGTGTVTQTVTRTEPDGSYTVYTYNPDSGGSEPDRPTSIGVFNSDHSSVAELDVDYDSNTGRPTQAQIGSRVVTYAYPDSSNAVIVTEASADPQVQTV